MSFGLGRGRPLDAAPGIVGISDQELPSLPDAVMDNPRAGWIDPRAWFPDPSRPFEIEIGSGKGTFLIQHAERHPEINFLGIEWAREFYEYAADRVRRRRGGLLDEEAGADALDAPPASALANVRILNTDASQLLRWRTPDAIIRVIHLYFSDPWPKSRHHRRRVIQDQFLWDCARTLIPGGEVRIVTDHDELWAWDCAHLAEWATDPDGLLPADAVSAGHADFMRQRRDTPDGTRPLDVAHQRPFTLVAFQPPASAGSGELVGSNFERKYRREGRPFHSIVLKRT